MSEEKQICGECKYFRDTDSMCKQAGYDGTCVWMPFTCIYADDEGCLHFEKRKDLTQEDEKRKVRRCLTTGLKKKICCSLKPIEKIT